MITRKLEYYTLSHSDRHLRDVKAMVRVSGYHIDFEALEKLINERDLGEVWNLAR